MCRSNDLRKGTHAEFDLLIDKISNGAIVQEKGNKYIGDLGTCLRVFDGIMEGYSLDEKEETAGREL